MMMKSHVLTFVLLVCAVLIMLGMPYSAAMAQGDKPLDLAIVIDNSESMTKPEFGEADPSGLRYVAAKMLIDLVSDHDRVGVVHFSKEARSLTEQPVLMSQQRDGLKQAIEQAQADEQGDTQYKKALDSAYKLLEQPTGN
jgi:hypothetical protein